MNETGRRKPIRVYCDGCFDLTHYGHANSFRQARNMGDILVAGIHTDADIARFKGPTVLHEQERYSMVGSIKWVDEVVEGATCWPTTETLRNINCDFIVHGDDICIASNHKDPYKVLRDHGMLKIFKRTDGISTSGIIEKVLTGDSYAHDMIANLEKLKTDFGVSSTPLRVTQRRSDTVYIPGVWDLLHVGHLEVLKGAKALGHCLLVGIFSDEEIHTTTGHFPVLSQNQRALSLLACKAYELICSKDTAENILKNVYFQYVDQIVENAPMEISRDFIIKYNIATVCHTQESCEHRGCLSKIMDNEKLILLSTPIVLQTEQIKTKILDRKNDFTTRRQKKEARESRMTIG